MCCISSYVSKHEDTLVFTRGVLSNFDKCTVEMDGMQFVTSEHAYQWRACTEALTEDFPEKVISTKFPIDTDTDTDTDTEKSLF